MSQIINMNFEGVSSSAMPAVPEVASESAKAVALIGPQLAEWVSSQQQASPAALVERVAIPSSDNTESLLGELFQDASGVAPVIESQAELELATAFSGFEPKDRALFKEIYQDIDANTEKVAPQALGKMKYHLDHLLYLKEKIEAASEDADMHVVMKGGKGLGELASVKSKSKQECLQDTMKNIALTNEVYRSAKEVGRLKDFLCTMYSGVCVDGRMGYIEDFSDTLGVDSALKRQMVQESIMKVQKEEFRASFMIAYTIMTEDPNFNEDGFVDDSFADYFATGGKALSELARGMVEKYAERPEVLLGVLKECGVTPKGDAICWEELFFEFMSSETKDAIDIRQFLLQCF